MSDHVDDEPASEPRLAAKLAAAEDRAQLRREMAGLRDDSTKAARWVLVVAVVQLLIGIIDGLLRGRAVDDELSRVAFLADDDSVHRFGREWIVSEYRAGLERLRLTVFAVPCSLAGAFLLLYIWARRSPIPALVSALFLFLALHIVSELQSASPVLLLLAKIAFAFVLVKGISSAMVRRSYVQAREAS